jgi:hypothetical protein
MTKNSWQFICGQENGTEKITKEFLIHVYLPIFSKKEGRNVKYFEGFFLKKERKKGTV